MSRVMLGSSMVLDTLLGAISLLPDQSPSQTTTLIIAMVATFTSLGAVAVQMLAGSLMQPPIMTFADWERLSP